MAVKEAAIERELCARVHAMGGLCEKVKVIGKRGFFDRLIVLPGGRIILVECKRPRGGVMRAHQTLYADRFRALNVAVAVVKNSADIDALLKK
jgi:hypothetical protein